MLPTAAIGIIAPAAAKYGLSGLIDSIVCMPTEPTVPNTPVRPNCFAMSALACGKLFVIKERPAVYGLTPPLAAI